MDFGGLNRNTVSEKDVCGEMNLEGGQCENNFPRYRGVLNSNFWNDTHQRELSDGTLIDMDMHQATESWIVIDDLDLHDEHIFKHQIKTDQTIGLTKQDIERAAAMLLK